MTKDEACLIIAQSLGKPYDAPSLATMLEKLGLITFEQDSIAHLYAAKSLAGVCVEAKELCVDATRLVTLTEAGARTVIDTLMRDGFKLVRE